MRQEAKETVYSFYERLMENFRFYSGMQNIEKAEMAVFTSYFVQGLRPEVRKGIEHNVVCWQTKPLDVLLRYANYYMDEEEAKQKQMKERLMVAQTALAQGTIAKMQVLQQEEE